MRSIEGFLDETAALDQLQLHDLPGFYLLADLGPPRPKSSVQASMVYS